MQKRGALPAEVLGAARSTTFGRTGRRRRRRLLLRDLLCPVPLSPAAAAAAVAAKGITRSRPPPRILQSTMCAPGRRRCD